MALNKESTANFSSFRGTPDAAYQTIEFGFKAKNVKIIVIAGSLDVSMNKSDATPHMVLGIGQYDFASLEVVKLHVKDVTAIGVQIIAWAN